MIDPGIVQFVHHSGVGNMSETVKPPTGRASVMSSIEVHFTTGTLSDDLTLHRDSRWGSSFDTLLMTLTRAGVGGGTDLGVDVNFPVDERQLKDWIFGGDMSGNDGIDALTINWTDPTDGSPTKWGILVGWVKVEDLA